MARNGAGVYSKAAADVVTGTTISSSVFNSLMDDFEADNNNARPVVAGGTGATTAAGARTSLAVPRVAVIAGAPDTDDDDSDTGGNGVFAAGDVWVDTSGTAAYVCMSASTGAADWDALGGVADVVTDTTPQLGGDLDTNDNNIVIDDAHGLLDENDNEQLIFQTTSSAVNHVEITNAATSGSPSIAAAGGDTNVDLTLKGQGSGGVILELGSDAAGDVYYFDGTRLVRLAKGAAGEFLVMNSGATAPEWGGLNDFSSATPTTSDSLGFVDADDSNASKKATIADILALSDAVTAPTSAALPVGCWAHLINTSSAVSNAATTAGSNLNIMLIDTNDALASGAAQTGTWTNISGGTVDTNEAGLFVRTA